MRINRTRRARGGARLTLAEELELTVGPGAKSAFKTDEDRRRAYLAHEAELLQENGRGWGWVTYRGGGFLPGEGGRVTKALARIDATNERKNSK